MYDPRQIAQVCHEANRALQEVDPQPGVMVAPPWHQFSAEEQAGVVDGVEAALLGATAEDLHESWCEGKRLAGWVYGPVKDAEAKTHPCLVEYDELPAEHRVKDVLFAAIVGALATS